ncbi:sugar phosphate nucleotidyltransferase [Marinilabiliaceae bacterium ANBcel2]|nr:sugar phosphate nucleotidyltransferase [Marinilabiliaceae bacterium ANBcel2]
MIDIIIGIIIVTAAITILISSIGILRFKIFFSRMHVVTKVSSFALLLFLVAVNLHFMQFSVLVKSLLIFTILIFLSPVAAHVVAKISKLLNEQKEIQPREKELNGMIFAAGLGSRLKPYTNSCPKALIEIDGHPLLEIALKKLERYNINHIVVNVHHHSNQIIKFIREYRKTSHAKIIISNEKEMLMDTGGALVKAKNLFTPGADILIYNADVFTNCDLSGLIKKHRTENNLVTLMTQNRDASRYLLFDQNDRLCGWEHASTGEKINVITDNVNELSKEKKQGFNGVQIVSSKLLELLNKEEPFPIIPEYLKLAENYKIAKWDNWNGEWRDIGTPEKLKGALKLYHNSDLYSRKAFF